MDSRFGHDRLGPNETKRDGYGNRDHRPGKGHGECLAEPAEDTWELPARMWRKGGPEHLADLSQARKQPVGHQFKVDRHRGEDCNAGNGGRDRTNARWPEIWRRDQAMAGMACHQC
ncbi:MAG: hypothetical protein WCZ66_09485 [Sphingomonadaceae bacterium]